MKKPRKPLSIFVTCLFISLLHLAFAFAKPNADRRVKPTQASMEEADVSSKLTSGKSVYDSLHLDLSGLNRQAFENATKGWEKLRQLGKLENDSIIAIVDFSQPSSNKRLYVLDMNNYRVLYNTLVAHGRNSGREWAKDFSNKMSSYKSSPGFYVTGQTYTGSNGYSLRLAGMEMGINDKALQRAIVMHGAPYVHESYIASRGFIGRSQGCPAVPVKDAKKIINTLKNGACLYIHVPDNSYLSRSVMLSDSAMG